MDDALRQIGRWLQDPRHWPLVVGLLPLVPCGWFVIKMGEAQRQKSAVEEIENMGGGVWYDYQFDASGHELQYAEPPGTPGCDGCWGTIFSRMLPSWTCREPRSPTKG